MEAHETEVPVRDIAVLTDFSRCSSLAVQYASALAGYHNAKMTLIHAIEPRAFGYFPDSAALEQLRSNAAENMRREDARLCGVRHEWLIAEGEPSELVQQVLNHDRIGVVVIGANGEGEPHNDVLGSTAEAIIAAARCPVLCVGPEVVDHDSFPEVSRVLFPTDMASPTPKAASYAASVAERYQAHLALLYVVNGGEPPDAREAEWLKAPYRERLTTQVRRGLYYPPDALVAFSDDPVDTILHTARQLPADLIVLGKAFHSTAKERGRKASRTIAQAPCPVMVIPERSGSEHLPSRRVPLSPLSPSDPVSAALVGNQL